ncbi:hypothetical protein K2X05_09980 [bacterium]|nr:hypothetical protein [bacterium]
MLKIFLILFLSQAATKTPTRVVENNLVRVSLQKIERPEAEPVSKPFEIKMNVVCKNTKIKKEITVPVCDFDINDKDHTITDVAIRIAHYAWDGAKSSNNPEGKNYCDAKNKLFHELKIADLCIATK